MYITQQKLWLEDKSKLEWNDGTRYFSTALKQSKKNYTEIVDHLSREYYSY
jgi:hypothetical protein